MKLYVYALFDPRKPSEVEYVGLTEALSSRIKHHVDGHDSRTKNWVKELRKGGIAAAWSILETTDEFNGHHVESKHIEKHNPRLNTALCKKPFIFETSPVLSLRDIQAKYVKWAFELFDGNGRATAKALGISRMTMYRKLRQ